MALAIPLFSIIGGAISSAATAVGTAGSALTGAVQSAQLGLPGAVGTLGGAGPATTAAGTTGATGATAGTAGTAAAATGAAEAAAASTAAGTTGTAAGATAATTAAVETAPTWTTTLLEAAKEAALPTLVVGSIGLGTTQGVLSYQAGQAAKAARQQQAREIAAASERRVASITREAMRYNAALRARAGAAGVAFEGSPAILGQEAFGTVTREAETLTANAAAAGRQLRREGAAAATAGNIGLGTGIAGGLINAGSLAMRVPGDSTLRIYG